MTFSRYVKQNKGDQTNLFSIKIPGCEIQDKSTSISIGVKFEEMSESDDDGDESDKHI